jgi:hypothetical protein
VKIAAWTVLLISTILWTPWAWVVSFMSVGFGGSAVLHDPMFWLYLVSPLALIAMTTWIGRRLAKEPSDPG